MYWVQSECMCQWRCCKRDFHSIRAFHIWQKTMNLTWWDLPWCSNSTLIDYYHLVTCVVQAVEIGIVCSTQNSGGIKTSSPFNSRCFAVRLFSASPTVLSLSTWWLNIHTLLWHEAHFVFFSPALWFPYHLIISSAATEESKAQWPLPLASTWLSQFDLL